MGPQHTDYHKLCKYMSTYATNPKPTLSILRVRRHVVANYWVVTKLLIVSRKSKVDYQNEV